MSTQINVTVGSGGLSDKARQLQTAARQAKLEGDRLTEVETTGTARRDQRLAQLGLSPQGVSLYAPDPRLPQIERRPAAYRIPGVNFGELYYKIDTDHLEKVTVTLYSQDGTASLIKTIDGTEKPEGYRSRASADRLPYLDEANFSYILQTSETEVLFDRPFDGNDDIRVTNTLLEHTGVSLGDPPFETTARQASSGGWGTFASSASIQTVCIPIGKDKCIFTLLHSRTSYKTYYLKHRVYVFDYFPLELRAELISYESNTTPGVTEYINSETYVSFYVDKSTVKEISTPASYIAKLKESKYWVPIQYEPIEVEGQAVENLGALLPLTPYTFKGVQFRGTQEYIDNYDYSETMKFYTWTFVASWGIPYVFDLRYYASPGIYTVINNPIDRVSFPYLTSEIKAYIPVFGQKYKWFRLVPATTPDKRIAQQYYGQLSENIWYAEFDSTKFKNMKTYPVYPSLGFAYSSLLWIDWNNPGYCRAEAKALGFTDADLTP